MSDAYVKAQLDARRWRLLSPTVLVRHNGPLTTGQARRAVVLSAASSAGLAGLCAWTALEHAGLRGWDRDAVHVLVPKGRVVVAVPSVRTVVHESRRLRPDDLRTVGGIATTSPARSAIDAAAWARDHRTACGVLAAVVQQRLTTADLLLAELVRAGSVRRCRLLRRVIADIAAGAQALSELDFLAFCRRHGFPRPIMQRVRWDASGRRRHLDATFLTATGRIFRVEIDGAPHLRAEVQWPDAMRNNDLALAGETVLHFPSWVVYVDDAVAVRQLAAALAS